MRKKVSPSVDMVLQRVRARIADGTYEPGEFFPAELQLANELGVSRGTVRVAIERLVETEELIRRQYSRPIVAPKPKAQHKGGTQVHVWITQAIANRETLSIVKGISEGLLGAPYQMIVREPSHYFSEHIKNDQRRFLEEVLKNDAIAGAILQRDPFADDDDLVKQVLASGKPLVFVDVTPVSGNVVDFVGTANTAAAVRCVKFLIEQGHRRIVCAIDSEVPGTLRQRREGYWRALRAAGLEAFSCELIATNLIEPNSSSEDSPREATPTAWYDILAKSVVKNIMAMQPRPTAIFAGCDHLAKRISLWLNHEGLCVPEDMSIVGFDWLGRWESDADELTTASQDFEGFGLHAAELLLDRLAGQAPAVARQVLLDAPLIIRNSTARRYLS